ncbi:unnamed protein product [Notodromas monacha]|uniref:receptor protein-tyrosine kinase n=1 Tax=Notodromas monacha TaxID=399045 RepID=A0A7R9BZJ3_9CRUS|nr:unnamed protein product [Notodromas monacha]CAG0923570.1 unnamed protein product [Notodromas monacha]
MLQFKHEHILRLLAVCVEGEPCYLLLELMDGGDLLSHLRSNRPTTHACSLESEILEYRYTHLHRFPTSMDLLEPLLLLLLLVVLCNFRFNIVKIGDFGLARDVYKNDYYRKEGEGLLPVRFDMMTKCWSYSPENRPSFRYCLEYLSGLRKKMRGLWDEAIQQRNNDTHGDLTWHQELCEAVFGRIQYHPICSHRNCSSWRSSTSTRDGQQSRNAVTTSVVSSGNRSSDVGGYVVPASRQVVRLSADVASDVTGVTSLPKYLEIVNGSTNGGYEVPFCFTTSPGNGVVIEADLARLYANSSRWASVLGGVCQPRHQASTSTSTSDGMTSDTDESQQFNSMTPLYAKPKPRRHHKICPNKSEYVNVQALPFVGKETVC